MLSTKLLVPAKLAVTRISVRPTMRWIRSVRLAPHSIHPVMPAVSIAKPIETRRELFRR